MGLRKINIEADRVNEEEENEKKREGNDIEIGESNQSEQKIERGCQAE